MKAESYGVLTDNIFLAIVFHDIVYDPRANDNEQKSAELFSSITSNNTVETAILDTATHVYNNDVSEVLCKLDLSIITDPFHDFVKYEHGIFKEYQFVEYYSYLENRINILSKRGATEDRLNHVVHRYPKIAVYPGSFNPFHVGHLDVLHKAEQVFDKVIISRGINPDKNAQFTAMPSSLRYHQVDNYTGLMTDYIEKFKYDVTVVRGLRDSKDLDYEMNQYSFLKDLKKDINVVSFFCDKNLSHVSSSAIRTLEKYDKETNYKVS